MLASVSPAVSMEEAGCTLATALSASLADQWANSASV